MARSATARSRGTACASRCLSVAATARSRGTACASQCLSVAVPPAIPPELAFRRTRFLRSGRPRHRFGSPTHLAAIQRLIWRMNMMSLHSHSRKIAIALAVLVAGTFAASSSQAAPICSAVTGNCYDYINRNLANTAYTTWTWEGARSDAQARSYMGMQGHLVTITSDAGASSDRQLARGYSLRTALARRLPAANLRSGDGLAMGDRRGVELRQLEYRGTQ